MDNQYPANSDKSREEYAQKHVSGPSISEGAAHVKKKTWFDQLLEFFGLGECKTFRDYVSTVGDMTNRVYGAIDTLMGGRPVNGAPSVPGARIAYSNMYNQAQQTQSKSPAPIGGYADLEFDYRSDAEVVLFRMNEILQLYKTVSVGDMFDIAGVTSPNGYTDQKFGWRNITGARVVPVGRKYRIAGLSVPVELR